jgi:anti-anti-sigma factor
MDQTTVSFEESSGGVKVVTFSGDLDSLGVKMVEGAFSSGASNRTDRIVVDLQQVGFISSAGLAMLLVRGKTLRHSGGDMVIAAVNPHVMEVMAMAGFEELFDFYPSSLDAVSGLAEA